MARLARGRGGASLPVTGEKGQSTVEFLLIAAAFSGLCLGLAAMWRAASSGKLLELATAAASHSFGVGIVAALKDIVAY